MKTEFEALIQKAESPGRLRCVRVSIWWLVDSGANEEETAAAGQPEDFSLSNSGNKTKTVSEM